MNMKVLSIAAALVVSSSASAGLVDVFIMDSPNQHPDGLHNTYYVIAQFDDATDGISAVAGVGDNPLIFFTGSGELYNQSFLGGLAFNDFPSVGIGGETYDSWVTLGNTNLGNVGFTPGFLGGTGADQVILGSSFQENDGAWFFSGAPLTVGDLEDAVDGNDTIEIVVAQFTVDAGAGFHLEGGVAWVTALAGGGGSTTPFEVDNIPAPGALALLGLAGLAGTRRRRR